MSITHTQTQAQAHTSKQALFIEYFYQTHVSHAQHTQWICVTRDIPYVLFVYILEIYCRYRSLDYHCYLYYNVNYHHGAHINRNGMIWNVTLNALPYSVETTNNNHNDNDHDSSSCVCVCVCVCFQTEKNDEHLYAYPTNVKSIMENCRHKYTL